MNKRFATFSGLFVALAAVLASSLAIGQSWPQKPVKVIVPFTAGGSADAVARIVSDRLTTLRGHKFLVDNRPGAGGAIAAELVARAPADGYTLFFAVTPQVSSLPLLQKVNYDPYKDFAPVSMVGTNFMVLGVHKSVPVRTVKELVEYAKGRPGAMNFGSAGYGTTGHLTTAMFLARAGFQMTHVPYKGLNQAFADLLAGHLQMLSGSASDFAKFANDDRITVLAVSSETRSPLFPNVATVAETYPGFRAIGWMGYLAPAGTPEAIIDQLSSDIATIVREPVTANRLKSLGFDPVGNTAAEFAEFLRMDAPGWRDAVRAAGLKPE